MKFKLIIEPEVYEKRGLMARVEYDPQQEKPFLIIWPESDTYRCRTHWRYVKRSTVEKHLKEKGYKRMTE